jgi:hypothetical protein
VTEPRVRAGSLPKRWSLVVALGVPVLVLFGIALGYYRLVYFERVAALHVPAAAHFAARIDLEQVVLFEPIRKNLLPVLDEASVVHGKPLSQRIATETGINLAMDLREIVVAVGPDEQWVVVLGGLFPKQALEGVVRAIAQDERLASSSISQGVLWLEQWALVAAQAVDGSFVISNQQQALLAALSGWQRRDGIFRKRPVAVEGPGASARRARLGPHDNAQSGSRAVVGGVDAWGRRRALAHWGKTTRRRGCLWRRALARVATRLGARRTAEQYRESLGFSQLPGATRG